VIAFFALAIDQPRIPVYNQIIFHIVGAKSFWTLIPNPAKAGLSDADRRSSFI